MRGVEGGSRCSAGGDLGGAMLPAALTVPAATTGEAVQLSLRRALLCV